MIRPTYRSHGRQSRATQVVVAYPGRETLAAILLAASAIAQADGVAERCERRALLAFLREQGLLVRHGRGVVIDAYEAAVECARQDGLIGALDRLAPLTRLAGTAAAPVIAAAAWEIALADGVRWPQETALLGVINDRLGLRADRSIP